MDAMDATEEQRESEATLNCRLLRLLRRVPPPPSRFDWLKTLPGWWAFE